MSDSAAPPAAPPPVGSMRWHAWLYSPPAARDVAAALFALEAECRAIPAGRLDHGAAHLKLQWWRDEFARLARGEPRHPLTTFVWRAAPGTDEAWRALHDGLSACELDLASAIFDTEAELDAYLALADGFVRALAYVTAVARDREPLDSTARAAGQAIRMAEVLRDLRQDAIDGRIRVPLDWLAEHGQTHVQLRAEDTGEGARHCLARLASRARERWRTAQTGLERLAMPELRGLRVLSELHAALVDRIERERYAVGRRRIALGPLRTLWTAWRAARQHGVR